MEQKFKRIRDMYPDYGPALDSNIKTDEKVITDISRKHDCNYPLEFIKFQTEYCRVVPMGDFAWDGFGWANDELSPYMNLRTVVEDARMIGLPSEFSPFRVDNGDYYCFDKNNRVILWCHDSQSIYNHDDFIWTDFFDWLEDSFNM